MSQKKFIIVQSKPIADKLIEHGFRLLTKSDEVYTFINEASKNVTFDVLDVKKIHFTDNLCL